MKIKVPVAVKIIVTEDSKNKLVLDIEKSIEQLKLELEQLQFQHKKLLVEAQKKGVEAVRIVQDRIGFEHQRRKEKLDRLIIQLEQVERLELEDELLHDTLETELEINIGDSWDEIYRSHEIIIKDGIVVDIKNGRR